MLLYPPMKDLLKNVPSRYLLVNMVANRARKISNEAELSDEPLTEKPVSIAVREVADGLLCYDEKNDAVCGADFAETEEEDEI